MAIPEEEARRYLPEERGIRHAFDVANRKYFRSRTVEELSKLPHSLLNRIADDYVLAAIAFFANRTGNPYLEEVGTATWQAAVIEDLVLPFCDTQEAIDEYLRKLGLQNPHDEEPGRLSAPAFIILPSPEDTRKETGIILITPEFIEKAKQPINALGEIAPALSFARDMKYGRKFIDPHLVGVRAIATAAEFVLTALTEDPSNADSLGDFCRGALDMYPEGIASLPPGTLYPTPTSAGGSL